MNMEVWIFDHVLFEGCHIVDIVIYLVVACKSIDIPYFTDLHLELF